MTLAILQVVSLAAVAAIIYWMVKLLYCQKAIPTGKREEL